MEALCPITPRAVRSRFCHKSKVGPVMATSDLTTQDLHNIRAFANRWGKIIARRAYGETGPGLDCDLLAMEQLAQAAAQGVLEGTLSVLLEQQAQALDDHQPCPQCQQPCLVRYQ